MSNKGAARVLDPRNVRICMCNSETQCDDEESRGDRDYKISEFVRCTQSWPS